VRWIFGAEAIGSPATHAASAILPPERIDSAATPYPAGAQGDASVELTAVIDASGAVRNVTLDQGPAPFVETAIRAVKSWRFLPARRDDAPIASRIKVVVTFHAPVPVKAPPTPGPPDGVSAPGSASAKGESQEPAATLSSDDTLTALQTSLGAGASAAVRGPGARIRAELEERMDPTARVRAGADVGVARFDVDSENGVVHAPHTDVEGGLYADVVWRSSPVVEVVPGVRLDGYQARGTSTFAPQPRAAAKIAITPALSWISALGVAHQEATEEVFVPAKLPEVFARADAYQFSEALELRLPSNTRVKTTLFYNRIVATDPSGEERTAGAEVFLRRDFTERLGGFVSYTLSRSDTIGPTTTVQSLRDRTHVVSTVLGYDLGRGWRAGARFFFESGRRYQAECPTASCAPGSIGPPVAVTGPLPPFYRLDVRLEKKWTFSGGQWLAGTLEGFNVLDKAEPTGEGYSPSAGLFVQKQSPIILPSIGIEGGI
jgi:TonB family protein